MPQYRRWCVPNSYYFFTLVTYKRQPIFQNDDVIHLLKDSIKPVKAKYPFQLESIVILPDHIHCIWKLPENETDFSKRWQLIKMRFSREYNKRYNTTSSTTKSRIKKREASVWQRRFWEHWIRDEKDLQRHTDYIHYNPVKHGYVKNPKDWKRSSFHKFVEKGWYNLNWGVAEPYDMLESCVGE